MQEGAGISKGMGSGEAVVFQPTPTGFLSAYTKQRQEAEKEKKGRKASIQKSLAPLDDIDIFFKHKPVFAKKIQDLYDYSYKNNDALIKGDMDKTMEFQQKVQEVFNDVNLSKGVKDSYIKASSLIQKDPNKYRSTTIDYLDSFEGYDPTTGQFQEIDETQFKENIPYQKRLTDKIIPLSQQKGKKGGDEYYSGAEGGYRTPNIDRITRKEADYIIEQDVMGDPIVAEQMNYDFSQLSPEKQKLYGDPMTYYKETYAPQLVYDRSTSTFTQKTGTDTYTPEDYETNQQEINYKSPKGKEDVESKFTTFGKIQHKQPYKAVISISPNWIEKDGNKKSKTSATVDAEFGETMIVPVFKSGQQKGTIIPTDDLKTNQDAGEVEYKVVTSVNTYDPKGDLNNTYYAPVEEVDNVLKNKGVPTGQLKADADKLNASNKKKVKKDWSKYKR